jgi:hypothetical protein
MADAGAPYEGAPYEGAVVAWLYAVIEGAVDMPLTDICATAALARERPKNIDFMIKRMAACGDNRKSEVEVENELAVYAD